MQAKTRREVIAIAIAARRATATLLGACALLLTHAASAQERLTIPSDEAMALRLLSWSPDPLGAPTTSGWRAAATFGASGSYHSVDDRDGAAEQLWGSAQGGMWGGWGSARGKAWLAFSPAQGANPQFLKTADTLPLRFGLTSEADTSVGSSVGVYASLRLAAGYEGQGPSPTTLLGPFDSAGGVGASMLGAVPFGMAAARAEIGGFNVTAQSTQHRWLCANLSGRLLNHAGTVSPTTRATEYGVGFAVYGQRVQDPNWRDSGLFIQGQDLSQGGARADSFDVLPIRLIWLDFADAVRPSQEIIEIRLAQGESLFHTQSATLGARAHLGWRLINDGQRSTENLNVIASLSLSVDVSSWGLSVAASRDAAPGADSAGVIAQDLVQARVAVRPPSWPVALKVIGAYARLSDMEVDVNGTDDERPNIRRGSIRGELSWTAWAPWRVTAAWTSGFGPSPDPSLWRPWILPSQRFDEATLSVSWQFANEDVSP